MSILLEDCRDGTAVIHTLIKTALSGKQGPVHLNIPSNLYDGIVCDYIPPFPNMKTPQKRYKHSDIKEVAQLLKNSRKPAILVGYGLVKSGSFEELKKIAEILGAKVATTPKAKGAFPENHSLSLGVFGFPGNNSALDYLLSDEIDVLLVIGSRLGEWSSYFWAPELKPGKALIRVDINYSILNCNYPAQATILGDAKNILQDLIQEINSSCDVQFQTPPSNVLNKLAPETTTYSDKPPIKPQEMIRIIQNVLPTNAKLFVDIGNSTSWVLRYLKLISPHSMFINLGFGSMGYSTAAAIGGKLASPESHIIAIVGDGAFAMNGMEIRTAAEYGIKITWIVLNNSGYGMMDQVERLIYNEPVSHSYFSREIDIAAIARCLGVDSYIVKTSKDFKIAFEKTLKSNQPCVIDARIDRNEIPPPLYERAQYLKNSFYLGAVNKNEKE